MSLLNVAVFSTDADFPTVCPAAVDIHDVPIVPALMLPVSLHVVADYTTFASIPLLLESLLSWPSSCCFYSCCCFLFCCCFVSSKLLQSLLLLLVAAFATVACIPAVDGHFCCCLRLFTIVSDVLIVAGLPAIVVFLEVVGVPAVAFVPACC